MSINYRVKKKKRRASDNRVTLVAQHKKKIDELNNLDKSVPLITKELNKIKKERDNLVLSSNGLGSIEAIKGYGKLSVLKLLNHLKYKTHPMHSSSENTWTDLYL